MASYTSPVVGQYFDPAAKLDKHLERERKNKELERKRLEGLMTGLDAKGKMTRQSQILVNKALEETRNKILSDPANADKYKNEYYQRKQRHIDLAEKINRTRLSNSSLSDRDWETISYS